jgi:hypothetical protein
LLEVLGGLTAGIYNYLREKNSQQYKLKDIIPKAYDYIYRPLTPEEEQDKTQQTLKAFMAAQAPKGMFE